MRTKLYERATAASGKLRTAAPEGIKPQVKISTQERKQTNKTEVISSWKHSERLKIKRRKD